MASSTAIDFLANTAGTAPQDTAETYNLCISFTRNGLTRRVPWIFVLYATGAEKGTRLRAKDASELTDDLPLSLPLTQPTNHSFRFLAREAAHIDNYSCHGRVVLLRNMTLGARDNAQTLIEGTALSSIVDGGKRDCQKWATECMAQLGFAQEQVLFWQAMLGKNVFEIEDAVRKLAGRWGWVFVRSVAWRDREVAEREVHEQKAGGEGVVL